jgi:uncharacterized membrane protein YdbT with pleckstrin-like domain
MPTEMEPGPALDDEIEETVFFEGRPAVVGSLGHLTFGLLTVGLLWLYRYIQSLRVHYRLTSQRVVIERGLLSKRTEQLDLYRIVDYVVDRPIGQRLLGTGNLTLHAHDRTLPAVEILGIRTDVRALYETLRLATEREKRRRGVRVLDSGHEGLF